MDAAAAAVTPAATTVTAPGGVFPVASAREAGRCACVCSCSFGNGDRQWSLPRCVGERAEGSPASAAVAASTVTGSGVFPAAKARGGLVCLRLQL